MCLASGDKSGEDYERGQQQGGQVKAGDAADTARCYIALLGEGKQKSKLANGK